LYCQLELGSLHVELRRQVSEPTRSNAPILQRGGASLLHTPSDDYSMCRLVCHTLEYWFGTEVSDYRSGLLCTDYGSVRAVRQTFQRCADPVRHEAKEENARNGYIGTGEDRWLIDKGTARNGIESSHRRPTCSFTGAQKSAPAEEPVRFSKCMKELI